MCSERCLEIIFDENLSWLFVLKFQVGATCCENFKGGIDFHAVFRKRFRDDIRCQIFWFVDCSCWAFWSGPSAMIISRESLISHTVYRKRFRNDMRGLFASLIVRIGIAGRAGHMLREFQESYRVCILYSERNWEKTLNADFCWFADWSYCFFFRGHLLWEFRKSHRLSIPCSGRSSEKTFNA